MDTVVPELSRLLSLDPNLNHFVSDLELRYRNFISCLTQIEESEPGGLDLFSTSYARFGQRVVDDSTVYCREWVPSAKRVSLVGDFNNWNPDANPLSFSQYGVWECTVSSKQKNIPPIPHLSFIKLCIDTFDGRRLYRLSPWARYTTQNGKTKLMEARFWNPPKKYEWKHPWPLKDGPPQQSLRIYEAHVGISSEDYKVASYTHFKDCVIPHVTYLNYNTIQLMAVMEHAYYASFGYQVTSFFAVSSRYGTPDELKELIDDCHKRGIRVLLDVVHSHACNNTEDGLNQFDGSNNCFFHDNGRGYHSLWNSRLFDYSQFEVKRFLLSNLRWFIDEYHFDGFRFDGVTSMLYHHHGNCVGFSGNYREYFDIHVDVESTTYLQLANHMLKKYYPNIIIIAEEVSGMPALCRPVEEGGLGFDYRLAMAIPDMWIKLLKEQKDEDWNMWNIVWTLINRRHGENHVAYAESHDQALVGDKTLAFWLMDAEMYWHMSVTSQKNLILDRGISLHKLLRLITMGLGGEAYLTFMGNEFGHPEWLDFPREGNNNSYHNARRQWHLVHESNLRYRFLNEFDRHMQILEEEYGWLRTPQAFVSKHHEADKIICFERGNLLWVFNFHPNNSYKDYRVPISSASDYMIVLSSDDDIFDGYNRVKKDVVCPFQSYGYSGLPYSLQLYIPSRVALVLAPITSPSNGA